MDPRGLCDHDAFDCADPTAVWVDFGFGTLSKPGEIRKMGSGVVRIGAP